MQPYRFVINRVEFLWSSFLKVSLQFKLVALVMLVSAISLTGACLIVFCLDHYYEPSLHALKWHLEQFLLYSSLLFSSVFVITLFLASALKQLILQPIHELIHMAHVVREQNNYKVKVKANTSQEFQILVDAFNAMLSTIERHDEALNQAFMKEKQTALELRRYLDNLSLANDQLAKENRIRVEIEQELDRTKNFLNDIINSMPSLLIGIDRALVVTEWNKEAESYTGIPARLAVGSSLMTLLPELYDHEDIFKDALTVGQIRHIEKFSYFMNDKHSYFNIVIYPLMSTAQEGAVIRMDDITTQIRLNEVVLQSEKMMSVGGLAAGMAHEINNPLGIILQSTQNIQRRFSPALESNVKRALALNMEFSQLENYLKEREIDHFLENIREAGERATRIVKDMLNFCRIPDQKRTVCNVTQLINRAIKIAYNDPQFRRISAFKSLDDELNVPCIAQEMEQVFLNILRNAAQALAAQEDPSRPKCIYIRSVRLQDMARIEFEDTGIGMTEDIRKRVFEPFFTTKPVGQGTGLGLSVSYFIITAHHNGKIECKSTPGEGTLFIIELPLQ